MHDIEDVFKFARIIVPTATLMISAVTVGYTDYQTSIERGGVKTSNLDENINVFPIFRPA